MKRVNKIGPPVVGPVALPPVLSMAEVVRRSTEPGVVVLDTRRDRAAWLASHLRGSLHTPPPNFPISPDRGCIPTTG